MADKPGPGREQERFPAQKEYQKPKEHKEHIDPAKAMEKLASSIDVARQMPQNNQEVIRTMLQDCADGSYMKKEQLDGYEAFASGKFDDPLDVHPGHIAYLYANNLLTEGREVVVGEYEDGYAMYHKTS